MLTHTPLPSCLGVGGFQRAAPSAADPEKKHFEFKLAFKLEFAFKFKIAWQVEFELEFTSTFTFNWLHRCCNSEWGGVELAV